MNIDPTQDAIDAFARSCELLNEFAAELRLKLGSIQVRTGADIRKYNNGWRLEKYVEAEINPGDGHTAAWWIDLGCTGGKWVVSSNVSISHTDIHVDLPERFATNSASLRDKLNDTIAQLTGMAEQDNAFGVEIRRILAHG